MGTRSDSDAFQRDAVQQIRGRGNPTSVDKPAASKRLTPARVITHGWAIARTRTLASAECETGARRCVRAPGVLMARHRVSGRSTHRGYSDRR